MNAVDNHRHAHTNLSHARHTTNLNFSRKKRKRREAFGDANGTLARSG